MNSGTGPDAGPRGTPPGDSPGPAPRRTGVTPALDTERDRVVARLTEGFARDEMSVEEYEHRVSAVYAASSRAELDVLAAELPAVPVPADPHDDLVGVPLRVDAILSNVVRSAPMFLPERLRLRSWAGNIEIDLSESRLRTGVTEIEVDVVLGNLEIVLPHHAHLDDQTSVILASFENPRGRGTAEPRSPATPPTVVRFRGHVVLGNLSVTFR